MRVSGKSGKAIVGILIVAVLGIVAAWHFIIKPAQLGAKEKETRTSIEVLRNALGKYYSQKGSYPETLDALIPLYISKLPNAHPHPMGQSSRVQYVASPAGLDYSGGWAFDNNPSSETYGRLFVNAKGKAGDTA
ncbi:MAG TPA: hypothetical protein PLL10_07960 [Elusimicrobiales bacterium]|nr:hypothetical protein [Elusimicrobiales bacterium]